MEQTVRARAVIFDMDGTLVDSNAVVEAIWTHFAERFGLVTADVLGSRTGGRRSTPYAVSPRLGSIMKRS